MRRPIKRKDLEALLTRVAALYGRTTDISIFEGGEFKGFRVGAWCLDYYSYGGGYQVEEYNTDGGGVICPFGHYRRPAREMYAFLTGIRDAIELRSSLEAKP